MAIKNAKQVLNRLDGSSEEGILCTHTLLVCLKASQKWNRAIDDLLTYGKNDKGDVYSYKLVTETLTSCSKSLKALVDAVQLATSYMNLFQL